MKRRRRVPLTQITNPTGRVDVAAYRIAERVLLSFERRGVRGLREHILPVVEAAIVESLPGRNLLNEIPPEVRAIFQACMENRRIS